MDAIVESVFFLDADITVEKYFFGSKMAVKCPPFDRKVFLIFSIFFISSLYALLPRISIYKWDYFTFSHHPHLATVIFDIMTYSLQNRQKNPNKPIV